MSDETPPFLHAIPGGGEGRSDHKHRPLMREFPGLPTVPVSWVWRWTDPSQVTHNIIVQVCVTCGCLYVPSVISPDPKPEGGPSDSG